MRVKFLMYLFSKIEICHFFFLSLFDTVFGIFFAFVFS